MSANLPMLPLAVIFCLLHYATPKCPMGSYQGLQPDDCYAIVNSNRNWYAAEQDCVTRGGHLASIPNGLVNAFLNEYPHTCASTYYIGAKWEYADGWFWSDGTPMQYTNWAPNEPQTNCDCCAYIDGTDSLWHTQACSYGLQYICNIPPTKSSSLSCAPDVSSLAGNSSYTRCGIDWIADDATHICFKVLDITAKDVQTARTSCKEIDADLPSLHSATENNFLTKIAIQLGLQLDGLFLGLLPNGSSDWTWVDGTGVNFVNWKAQNIWNEHTAPSVVAHTRIDGVELGRWGFADASGRYGVMCQKPWKS